MRGNVQFSRQLAVTENLVAFAAAIGKAGFAQRRFIDASAVIKLVQVLNIDRQITSGMARVVEAALGNAADERHLPTLEANADRAAGSRGLAFAASAAGFSVAAGFALAEPLAPMLGSRTRFEIM